ncbi:MAG: TRAP transporter substrate-binding protein DctP, partial [Chloroflexi bacterium]|nr:TRAP transporter substrate-binding protein DctP [Chloroflexota bacterium]
MRRRVWLIGGIACGLLLLVACAESSPALKEPAKPAAPAPAPAPAAAPKPAEPAAKPAQPAAAPKPAQPAKPAAEKAPAGTVVWNLPSIYNPSDYQYTVIQQFVTKVKEKSGGRFEIRHHAGSSLYGAFDIPVALLDGRVEVAHMSGWAITDSKPHLAVSDLPYTSQTEPEGRKVVEALIPYYKRELEKLNLVYLFVEPWPAQNLFTAKDPVRTVDEWKGKKIRSYSVDSAGLVRALGGSPVTIPSGELYVGMQRGLAEGAVTSTMFIHSTKTYEVIKYANLWQWNAAPNDMIAVHKKHWDALPADLRKVITDVIAEEKIQEKVWELHSQGNANALKFIADQGVQRVDIA